MVHRIITNLAVIDVVPADQRAADEPPLRLVELAPGISADDVLAATEPALTLP